MRRFLVFIIFTLLLINLIDGLALRAILHRLAAPCLLRGSFALFFILQAVGIAVMVLAGVLRRQPGTGLGRPLLSLLMIWNLLLSLPTAVIAVLVAVVWRIASGPAIRELHPDERTIGLLLAGFPLVLALVLTAVAVWQLGRFRINRLTVTIPNLPAALRGLTLVHLSDLHIGKLTRGKVLQKMVVAVNQLNPDLILATGDLINISLEDLPVALDLLGSLKSRHGLFLCEGNHDLIESRSGFETAAKASGLAFLFNEQAAVTIQGERVRILGLSWGEAMKAPSEIVHRLLAEGPAGAFTILLAHHPDAFDAAAEAGIPLTLAGHTHGGQLMLRPKIGFGPWLYRYWSGLYQRGESRLVVSNGAGNWFPLRINVPAEIIHLTLR